MKTKFTIFCLSLSCLFLRAQTVADFETFTLAASSAYSPNVSTPFQTSNAIFRYVWDPSFGGFWSKGFAYTNIQDSVNGTFNNLYGVHALKGYSNSPMFVVGQDSGIIKLKAPYDVVDGFYITNTTYAYKVIKNGNGFSRKFGDTTGTKSPTTMTQGSYPDYFKIVAKGFKNGVMKPDSAVFYLADYRFANNTQDYVLDTWQWFNTSGLGAIDSIRFFLRSSDFNQFGMKTPAFFAMDNFSTSIFNPVGLSGIKYSGKWSVYPNPCSSSLIITGVNSERETEVVLRSISGMEISRVKLEGEANELDLTSFSPGIYFLELTSGNERLVKRLIKE
jgi:hypothetical protein